MIVMQDGNRLRTRCRSSRLRIAALALRVAAIVPSAGGCFLFPETPPVARIEVDQVGGVAPLTVRFDGAFSTDPDGAIRRYQWDFGDGGDGKGAQVEHTYSDAGTYQATLTVIDTRWARATASVTIAVRETNALPVAAFSVSPSPAYPRQTIQFDAGASHNPDGQIVSYEWSFGDEAIGSGIVTAHQYQLLGI